MSSCVSLFFCFKLDAPTINNKKNISAFFLNFFKDRDIPLKYTGENRMEVPKLTNNQPAFYL
jgi:hypothetical protein